LDQANNEGGVGMPDTTKIPKSSDPIIDLNDVLDGDHYIPDNAGTIEMMLAICSGSGSATVDMIDVFVDQGDGVQMIEPCHCSDALRAGETRVVSMRIRLDPHHLDALAFTVSAHLQYRLRSGEMRTSRRFTFPVRLASTDRFSEIANPYSRYASGGAVQNPAMFFGRQDVLVRIMNTLNAESLGQCFVLYGQKRSGKTSILQQLLFRLSRPTLGIYLSLGAIDSAFPVQSFVTECLTRLVDKVQQTLDLRQGAWPSQDELRADPPGVLRFAINTAERHLREAGWNTPRIVFLVDEFTYLYEYIKHSGLRSEFMRFWKVLLDMKLFNAVVVGQDAMPAFIRDFPNDLVVNVLERLGYLRESEAIALADEPILLAGRSRYRGRALSRLFELTAGSPFYMQLICDRLVRHLNSQKTTFITEADVDTVLRSLVFSNAALDASIFDPLISATGDFGGKDMRDTCLRLLLAVARNSLVKDGVKDGELPEALDSETAVKDMLARDVLRTDRNGRLTIPVGLFVEWLKVNHGPVGIA
jgi:hypothetical protein